MDHNTFYSPSSKPMTRLQIKHHPDQDEESMYYLNVKLYNIIIIIICVLVTPPKFEPSSFTI